MKLDLGAALTAVGLSVAAIVFIVRLDGKVEQLEVHKLGPEQYDTIVEAINKKLESEKFEGLQNDVTRLAERVDATTLSAERELAVRQLQDEAANLKRTGTAQLEALEVAARDKMEMLSKTDLNRVEIGECSGSNLRLKDDKGCIVKFSPPFQEKPKVLAGISTIDTGPQGTKEGLRLKVWVHRSSREMAEIRMRTWHKTVIAGTTVSWIAVGR